MAAKDGGSAYAGAADQKGMTLRDYHAAKVLPALIALHPQLSAAQIATMAYEYGLHMLDARDRVNAR